MSKNRIVESRENTPIFDNQILRVEQVAEMLQFSKWHVYRLVNQNKIPFYKKGKTLFFMKPEIIEWINEGAA
jgi:excisionase family DNA binding protein